MLNNVSIQTKLIAALALILLINLFTGGVVLYSIMSAKQSVEVVENISTTKNYFVKLEENALGSRQHMAAFLNSGDLNERDLAVKSYEEIFSLIDEVKTHIEDDALLNEHLDKFQAYLKEWYNTIASHQIEYMRSPQTVDMARLIEGSAENTALWAALHDEFQTALTELTEVSHQKSLALNHIMDTTNVASVIGLALTLLTIIAASIFIIVMVSKPLQQLVVSTNGLVRKEWNTEIFGATRGDEIGQMADALLLFRDNGIENEKLMEAQKLEDQKQINRAKNIEELVAAFRDESSEVTTALEGATQKMSLTSVTMSDIANDTSMLSEEVSRSAQSAGSNVNNVSAATEELTSSIQEISKQLGTTNRMAQGAKNISADTVDKMKVLESSAKEIDSVIEIISDIAEQTNLLALNATIEAARAGDAGKGFAVVASEVKNLASETAKATEQVREQIDRIQGDTSDAVSFIEKISESIEQLTESMTAIAAAMEEQTAATQEISRNVSEASQGTNTVVENISNVSEATRKTQETSKNVNDIAGELSDRSDKLKESISAFISNIQAA